MKAITVYSIWGRAYLLTKTRLQEQDSGGAIHRYSVTAAAIRRAMAPKAGGVALQAKGAMPVFSLISCTRWRSWGGGKFNLIYCQIGCARFSPPTFSLILKTMGLSRRGSK